MKSKMRPAGIFSKEELSRFHLYLLTQKGHQYDGQRPSGEQSWPSRIE